MTFAEIKSLLHYSTKKDDLLGAFTLLVNQAIREIETDRSWRCMEHPYTLVIPAGQRFISIPMEFKEPQHGAHPLRAIDPDTGGFSLWKLQTKQEANKLSLVGVNVAERIAYIGIADLATGQRGLYMPLVLQADTTFTLDTYAFLPDLVNPDDTNYFLQNYPFLVLEKAKELVFRLREEDANSAADCHGLYQDKFMKASADDAARKVTGRNMRMGGY